MPHQPQTLTSLSLAPFQAHFVSRSAQNRGSVEGGPHKEWEGVCGGEGGLNIFLGREGGGSSHQAVKGHKTSLDLGEFKKALL